MTARKVSDYKVELYQFYNTGTDGKGFAAMYEITIPEPAKFYLAGEFQGWAPENAVEMTYDGASKQYTYTFADGAAGGFKLSTVKGGWDTFNGGVLGASDDDYTLPIGQAVTLESGKTGNLCFPGKGNWAINYNADTKAITLTGEAIVELPDVYLRGVVNDWTARDEFKFSPVIADGASQPALNANGEYEMVLEVARLNGQFKLGDETQNFENFNYGAANSNAVTNGGTIEVKQYGGDISMGGLDLMKAHLTFYYNPDRSRSSWLKIEGIEYDPDYVELPDVYLRGTVNGWEAQEAYKFTPVIADGAKYPTKNDNGEYQYTLHLDRLQGDFKLGDTTTNFETFNYGGDGEAHTVTNGVTLKAWPGSTVNFVMGDLVLEDVTLNFYYNAVSSPSYLQISGEEVIFGDRAHFAYDLDMQFNKVNGLYRFTFKTTGAARNVTLVATPQAPATEDMALLAESEHPELRFEMGSLDKGEHSIELYDIEFAWTTYKWAVEVENYEIPKTSVIRTALSPKSTVTSKNKQGEAVRGSVVPMVDPEYPSYGYTVVGHNWDFGFDIYDPEGNLVKTGVHKDHTLLHDPTTQANRYNISNGSRGAEHRGHVLIASWGDDAHGVTAFDPINTDEDMYSVFEGEKSSNGTISKNGVKIGSGTPCVAIQGKGDDAMMYTFDEDVLGNNIARYKIGTSRTVATAPENIGFNEKLGNTNVAIAPVKEGVFVSQVRGEKNSRNNTTPGLMFINNEGKDVWYVIDYPDETFLTSSNSAVAVNKDETLLAVSSYTKIHVMNLSFADGKPVLSKREDITLPASTGWATMRFDAADNIHIYALGQDANHGYRVYALANKKPVVTTAAPSSSMMMVSTGVENVEVDGADNEAPVYYNLNGIRVSGDNLTPGVYVKVIGKTATKVVVK